MSDNNLPTGRFVPRTTNRLGLIPGLQTIDQTTPKNPTLQNILGSQVSTNDYFRRRLGRLPKQTNQNGPATSFNTNKGKTPLNPVNPVNRVLNSVNDPEDTSHDTTHDNMNIDTTLATSCEEPAVGVSLFAWTGLL
ncbi:hypothetical protein PTTG_28593 [Puccinia triticina 1-1 BBBD Race 1]|uniref:Uncharacterized protein n=1 Tax=Puccinia triticina (isolate 1-1 / race 1 (BBBD)) TaxID=630390 RepID=A0A180GAP9_PUCT1|nr:hypothetical protein PTTG_28593 [Puccinia triticina 1-1 BBBD Race 1]